MSVDWRLLSAPGLRQFCVASKLSFPLKVSLQIPIKVLEKTGFSSLKKSKSKQSDPLNIWNFSAKCEDTSPLQFIAIYR